MTDLTRISGLASGFDTESIIQSLMDAHRIPVDRLKQERQVLEWQREDYRTINRSLAGFRDNYAFDMRLQGAFLAMNAISSDDNIVTASATSSTQGATYYLENISLAKVAYNFSASELSKNSSDKIDPDETLWSQKDKFAGSFNESFSFSITTYDQDGTVITVDFQVDANTESLNDVLNRISSHSSLGLTAYYDAESDKVSIATTRTGNNNETGVEIKVGNSGFLFDVLHIDENNEQGGTDASVTINGLAITRKSNDFTLNGVNFSLHNAGNATVTVERDTDQIVQAITDFINEYNKILQQLNDKLSEEYYRDYPPLTDKQKEQLTDTQIEKWEERARSGLLRNDSLLRKIVNDLRLSMSDKVSGLSTYDSLASIGITTRNYQEKGLLHIDEDELHKAVETAPDAVMNLFTTDGSTHETTGIGQRIYEKLKTAIDLLTQKAGNPDSMLFDNSSISRSIRDIDEKISNMEKRLQNLEDRYWRQFTAMEQAISRMNAQSSWLAQQFFNS